jgi:molybdopterin molybdotransferase
VTFLILVRPFLLRLQGLRDAAIRPVTLRADFACTKPDKRQEFLRVRRNENGGLDLFPNQSSGVLTSLVWGDGLVDKPAGATIAAGDMVQFISYENLY